jgi:hypothetical protein
MQNSFGGFMKQFLIFIFLIISTFQVSAEEFNCATKYAGFIPTGKLRISGNLVAGSLTNVNAEYFNNVSYQVLPLKIDSQKNPDKDFKPRQYKGFHRYVLTGDSSGEAYDLFLPKTIQGPFKAYIVAWDFEDKSPRYEILCK